VVSKVELEEMKEWHARLTECYKMVGEFMYNYALLETDLNQLLGQMMGLENPNAHILTSSMDVSKKLNIAICGIKFQPIDHEAAAEVLKELFDINGERKIVAHCLFGPSKKGDGIEFYRITTNRKLNMYVEYWTKAQFAAKIENMKVVRNRIQALEKAVTPIQSEKASSAWLGQSLGTGILGSFGSEE
jgi:hypothetical protein